MRQALARISKMRRICSLALAITILGLALFFSTAQAATESLTVSPLKGEFKLAPGQQANGSIKIKNSGEKPIDVEVYVQTFAVTNENYDQEFHRSDNKLAAENWVSLSDNNYKIQPKQQITVNYLVNVPLDSEPGGHYAAIFTQTKPVAVAKGEVVQAKRVAHLLYLEIAGQVSKVGQIVSTKTDFWQKHSPIYSRVRAKNGGNTHYRVDGSVTVKNLFGGDVSKARFDGLLMPGTVRLFAVQNEAPNWPGLYRVETKVGFPSGRSEKATSWILYLPLLYIYIVGGGILITSWLLIKKRFHSSCRRKS